MLAVQNFQQRLFSGYQRSLTLPPTYKYLYGNPVQPLVPLHTSRRGVLIIGASPPARLAAVAAEEDVPVGDLTAPFVTAAYFDGRRIRSIPGGQTLAETLLQPLGLNAEQCWLTYLVRVFLFDDSHVRQYRRLGCNWPEWETRSRFEALARQSLPWLAQELALARPKLVITLGANVAGVLQGINGREARAGLLGGQLTDLWLDDTVVYPVLHLPHPGTTTGTAGGQVICLPAAQTVVRRLVGDG
jgi:hypothetical protein